MTDPHIKNRKRIRDRLDNTAIHSTIDLSADNAVDVVRMDIVCQKITIQVAGDGTFAVDITASVDGKFFFAVDTGLNNEDVISYGSGTDEHLIKIVKVTRTAGAGKVVIVGV